MIIELLMIIGAVSGVLMVGSLIFEIVFRKKLAEMEKENLEND